MAMWGASSLHSETDHLKTCMGGQRTAGDGDGGRAAATCRPRRAGGAAARRRRRGAAGRAASCADPARAVAAAGRAAAGRALVVRRPAADGQPPHEACGRQAAVPRGAAGRRRRGRRVRRRPRRAGTLRRQRGLVGANSVPSSCGVHRWMIGVLTQTAPASAPSHGSLRGGHRVQVLTRGVNYALQRSLVQLQGVPPARCTSHEGWSWTAVCRPAGLRFCTHRRGSARHGNRRQAAAGAAAQRRRCSAALPLRQQRVGGRLQVPVIFL